MPRRTPHRVSLVALLTLLVAAAALPASAASGDLQWKSTIAGDDARGAAASDVVISVDGSRVFSTGSISRSGTSDDYLTIAYDAATGTELWRRRYDGSRHRSEEQ